MKSEIQETVWLSAKQVWQEFFISHLHFEHFGGGSYERFLCPLLKDFMANHQKEAKCSDLWHEGVMIEIKAPDVDNKSIQREYFHVQKTPINTNVGAVTATEIEVWDPSSALAWVLQLYKLNMHRYNSSGSPVLLEGSSQIYKLSQKQVAEFY